MFSLRRRTALAVGLFWLVSIGSNFINGQVAAPKAAVTPTPTQTGQAGPAKPLGDFIPCMFDPVMEQYDLRVQPRPNPTAVINSAKASDLLSAVKASLDATFNGENTQIALNQTQLKAARSTINEALTTITPDKLVGLAPAAATSSILDVLRNALTNNQKGPALTGLVLSTATSAINDSINSAYSQVFHPPARPAPPDVSCSIQILSWRETSDLFGRRVANTYIAIQVTIRNLNQSDEFLVHDIQVAVDTGNTPDSYSRFGAGRDKLFVRGVAERGQSEDRRNLAVNALVGIGAIASSSVLAGSADFKAGVAVFTGAFIPAFEKLFPDHTVEQLNHINDLGFSASANSKVLVPVEGSVPLVTFVSQLPFTQMPFAWCGHNSVSGFFGKRKQEYCESGNYEANLAVDTYPNGYRVDEVKRGELKRPPANSSGQSSGTPSQSLGPSGQSPGASGRHDGSLLTTNAGLPGYYPVAWDPLPYKKWLGAAMRILTERTFVVVGGVHIHEMSGSTNTASNFKCPTISGSGAVDITKAQGGSISCTVQGIGLDQFTTVTLQEGSTKINGKIQSATDGLSATVTLDAATLSGYSGTYTLILNGKSILNTGDVVLLAVQPVVAGADSTLDLSKPSVKVTGTNLQALGSITLREDGGSSIAGKAPSPLPTGSAPKGVTSIEYTFDAHGLKPSTKYGVFYTSSADPSNVQQPNPAVTVTTGTATGPATTSGGNSKDKKPIKK